MTISFNTTDAEDDIICKIVRRAGDEGHVRTPNERMNLSMDLTACHCNGCPLDLQRLLKAPLGDFGHDINGITAHMDRNTGQLLDCFVPRYAAAGGYRREDYIGRKVRQADGQVVIIQDVRHETHLHALDPQAKTGSANAIISNVFYISVKVNGRWEGPIEMSPNRTLPFVD